jgi:nicotinamide-nucleotide amidase
MPTAALLLIGSELTDPARRDANGTLAAARLRELGFGIGLVARVEDRVEAIAAAVSSALDTCDAVIASGGLGPTGDDLTREGAARALGVGIREDETWAEVLRLRLASRGRPLDSVNRRQALVVEGGETVPNPRGLACGCWVRRGGAHIILLPGVPGEFGEMLETSVLPGLREAFPDRPEVRTVKAVLAGLAESAAEPVLSPWYARRGVSASILPHLGILRVTLTLSSPPADSAEALEAEARRAFADGWKGHLVSLDGSSLEQVLGEALLRRGWSLAAAESCTGGLLAQKVVGVPGASRYFLGSVTAYDNAAKRSLLGVAPEVLERHGAVSEETARAMVRGARARFGASCAAATTGVAGPDGGSPDKPAGTVWIAVGTPEGEWAHRVFLPLDRLSVMEFSAHTALFHLWRRVRGVASP